MTLPRILTAVPPLPHVQLEIAKAIQTLAAGDDQRIELGTVDPIQSQRNHELITEIVRDAWKLLGKTGYNPSEPRVPAGNPDGGQWTAEGSGGPTGAPGTVLSDVALDNNWIPGARYAANDRPGIGHNQGPPLDEPPEVPVKAPFKISTFLKAAAYWIASAIARGDKRVALFLAALLAAGWLTARYYKYIVAYQEPPKTWDELQQNALRARPGYDIHHPVEQKSARDDGFPDGIVDGPGNRLRIPTLKHWQINGWYGRPNPEFKDKNDNDMSPRDYLKDKSWDERLRVGKEALILFGVLKP